MGTENTVFLSGRWPRGGVCFYGALLSLFEQEDEPGGDCRENRRNERICIKAESETIEEKDTKRFPSAKKVSEDTPMRGE